MLKLTYIESDLYLEPLNTTLESFVAQRVVLALRLGRRILTEPGSASFLLPLDLPDMAVLATAVRLHDGDAIALCQVDEDYAEVSLRGTWLADDLDAHEGVLICAIAPTLESMVYRLWQMSRDRVSFLT
jgi:hypothetical protein